MPPSDLSVIYSPKVAKNRCEGGATPRYGKKMNVRRKKIRASPRGGSGIAAAELPTPARGPWLLFFLETFGACRRRTPRAWIEPGGAASDEVSARRVLRVTAGSAITIYVYIIMAAGPRRAPSACSEAFKKEKRKKKKEKKKKEGVVEPQVAQDRHGEAADAARGARHQHLS